MNQIYRYLPLAGTIMLAMSNPSAAVTNCRAKLARDNTILVSASDVQGPLRFGFDATDARNQFWNESTCVAGTEATNCELGAPGSSARKAQPYLCDIVLTDDTSNTCTASLAVPKCHPREPQPAHCGNAILELNEACEWGQPVPSCLEMGFGAGTTTCIPGVCQVDTDGCDGPLPKRIFVSRERFVPGDNGPPIGWFQYPSRGDALCQKFAAENAELAGKTWKALICGREPDVGGGDYLGVRQRSTASVAGYVRVGSGVVIATNQDDLLDGTLQNSILNDQFGQPVTDGAGVWTGCTASGASVTADLQCAEASFSSWWAQSGIYSTRLGHYDRTDASWIDDGTVSTCGPDRHIYCIEQ